AYLTVLLTDRERAVRKAARDVLRQIRERPWAKEYLDRILSVRGFDNDEVLRTYRYGRALARIGDDGDKRRLQEHLANELLPLHVGHWISGIIKAIDDRWREVTRKWPKPWLGWEGTIEELDGQGATGDGRSSPGNFSVWR